MEFGAGTPLEEFRGQVRAFVAAHAPGFRVRSGVRSPENAAELAELQRWTADLYAAGHLGADWPEEYGGVPDPDPLRQFVVGEEIARARAPMPVSGGSLAAHALIEFGSDEQKRRYLPRIRSGVDVWCQLFSEPDAGSDLASLRTTAVRDGDEWVVNGQKVWTTNGHWARYGYLLARTDPEAPKHKGISAFVLDMGLPGVRVRPLRELTGTSDFNEVFFDDVRLPAGSLIGAPGAGWLIANTSLAEERNGVGVSVVQLQMAWQDLVDLARELVVDGRPALDLDDVRLDLARFRAEVDACALLAHTSMAQWRAGRERVIDAPATKLAFSELNLRMAEYAVSLPGAAGVLTEGDPEAVAEGRWQDAYLYARAYTIAGGSSEIMRNIIAERALGLPREPR
ncbi:acyl-CoA dehydrogenase family protein [Actinomadura livida]|uniref:Acyl-CoA dehydrogenase family protein n=1 Tax=Actinomadura livida TaxID=79909 RepID=A0A7W7MZI7_9ACTN|nr:MULTISPECIES: acyl-CoA dehydrogenase family protein [Actinomadura]MBB4776089.1 alkylation response protein AidB-like acyl-CoA dehydrogenase [Actinomadura catellatispora]GGU15568.1 acyl-CoA dehydrogenase [Actinomadura livida]